MKLMTTTPPTETSDQMSYTAEKEMREAKRDRPSLPPPQDHPLSHASATSPRSQERDAAQQKQVSPLRLKKSPSFEWLLL